MQKRYLTGAGFLIAIIFGVLFAMFSSDTPLDECSFIGEHGNVQQYANTCSTDSDCGESGAFGETYCKDGDVYQGYYQVDCVGKPDTCESKCQSRQTQQLVKKCPEGCMTGQCM